MSDENRLFQEVLESSPPKLIEEADKLFEEYPFDNAALQAEEDFDVDDYDTAKTTTFITEEEKNELASKNMPLVYYIVSKFGNTGIDPDELFSVALVGYEKALSKFNPGKNTKFSTFAYRCIQNEIFYFIRGEKKIYEKTVSLSYTLSTDKNGNDLEVDDTIPSEDPSMDEELIKEESLQSLMDAIRDDLSENERLIITRRFGIGTDIMTQNELARMVSMSQANISKKEKNILEKLRKILISKYKVSGKI